MTDVNHTTTIATTLALLTTLIAVAPGALAYPDGCAGGLDAGDSFATATPFSVAPGVQCGGAVGSATDLADIQRHSVGSGTSQFAAEVCYWQDQGVVTLWFEPIGGSPTFIDSDTTGPNGKCGYVQGSASSLLGGTWYLHHAPNNQDTDYQLTYWV